MIDFEQAKKMLQDSNTEADKKVLEEITRELKALPAVKKVVKSGFLGGSNGKAVSHSFGFHDLLDFSLNSID